MPRTWTVGGPGRDGGHGGPPLCLHLVVVVPTEHPDQVVGELLGHFQLARGRREAPGEANARTFEVFGHAFFARKPQ